MRTVVGEKLVKVVHYLIGVYRAISHGKVFRFALGNGGNNLFRYIAIEASNECLFLYTPHFFTRKFFAFDR